MVPYRLKCYSTLLEAFVLQLGDKKNMQVNCTLAITHRASIVPNKNNFGINCEVTYESHQNYCKTHFTNIFGDLDIWG